MYGEILEQLIKEGFLKKKFSPNLGYYLIYPNGDLFDGNWEIFPEDRKAFFKEHYIFTSIPDLEESRLCIHCNSKIKVGDYKAYINFDEDRIMICCPNAPECDGSIIDWMDIRDK